MGGGGGGGGGIWTPRTLPLDPPLYTGLESDMVIERTTGE